MSLHRLATRATRVAARFRGDYGIDAADALCHFDLAERLGIVVRLVALPSLEGMYSPGPMPTILVNAERPVGRRRYNCGHELGHHLFGHGTRLDEIADDGTAAWGPEELTAQRFAAALLMPKLAVEVAFARRGWRVSAPNPECVLIVAQNLGVGYSTLVGHLQRTLRLMPSTSADVLRRASLPSLRSRLAGFKVDHDLVVVDEHWGRRPIDIEVGDIVLLPKGAAFEGVCAELHTQPVQHLKAALPGIGALALAGNRPPIPVRVSRRGFIGLARYRHLEEAADDR